MIQLQFNHSIFHNAHFLYLLNGLRLFTTKVSRYIRKHPWQTAFVLLSILSILVVPVILPAIGFSSIGPVAESLAAAWQSSIGIVVAGTPFTFLQSAAMGGAAAGIFYGIGGAGLAVVAGAKVAGFVRGWWNSRNSR